MVSVRADIFCNLLCPGEDLIRFMLHLVNGGEIV